MPALPDQFQKFIVDHRLASKKERLLVAVSGGVDSVVLCHLLNQNQYEFGVAHCNFGLRGAQSDLDETFVKELAQSFGSDFYSKRFETQKYSEDHGISIQMAARELRYTWFKEVLAINNYQRLATAHHANDQVETIIFNLAKGTGIAGLRGMEFQKDEMIRPLLFASKEEIMAFASEAKIVWREDASNEQDKYHRNRIRNHVVPELQKINPGLKGTFEKNIARFSSLEKLLNTQVAHIQEQYLQMNRNSLTLDMQWFNAEKGGEIILEELLKPFGFNLHQCQNIIASFLQNSGRRFITPTHELTIDRGKLLIDENTETENVDLTLQLREKTILAGKYLFTFDYFNEKIPFDNDPMKAFLDADATGFPIKIRNWQKGDRFRPLGMKSDKKLSDFLVDEKIPMNLKKQVLVFESRGEIIWVAGYRISDRFKITPKTTSSLVIHMSVKE